MTAQERLTILRGIEKKVKNTLQVVYIHANEQAEQEVEESLQLLNFLIMDDLKSVQAQDEAKIRKDGAN